jgi:hypothetical protein
MFDSDRSGTIGFNEVRPDPLNYLVMGCSRLDPSSPDSSSTSRTGRESSSILIKIAPTQSMALNSMPPSDSSDTIYHLKFSSSSRGNTVMPLFSSVKSKFTDQVFLRGRYD